MRLRAAPSGHCYKLEVAGAGKPLLLMHGFSGSGETWQDIVAALSPGFRLICLDILGHGDSDKPETASRYRMPAIAADIIDLLDQLHITHANLLGYSMGGRLALYLALRYPERFSSLVLESASPGLADETERARRRQQDEALADRIEAHGIRWFVDFWEGLPLWASQSQLPSTVLQAQRNQRLSNDPRGLANSLRGMGAGAQPDLWQELPTLAIPALLVVGELDHKFRRINQAMTDSASSAELAVISSAGHNTHLENPTAFARVVRSFLQGI